MLNVCCILFPMFSVDCGIFVWAILLYCHYMLLSLPGLQPAINNCILKMLCLYLLTRIVYILLFNHT